MYFILGLSFSFELNETMKPANKADKRLLCVGHKTFRNCSLRALLGATHKYN